jgi:Fe-Mn family superoxide dismutase
MNLLEQKIEKLQSLITEEFVDNEFKSILSEMKKIGIEKLPYAYSALKPFIDAKTMKIHYTKHYLGYVDKLNKALSKRKGGDVDLENIIKTISKFDTTIRNNAGGAFNHSLFWNMLSPTPIKLKGELHKKIIKQYGGFPQFKSEFEKIAKERFGSGWVWLILTKNNRLKIISTPNQDNPLMDVVEDGGFPLLGLDLWEHAYYLKYLNKRDEYISNFWDVVNWDFVSKMYEMKTNTDL